MGLMSQLWELLEDGSQAVSSHGNSITLWPIRNNLVSFSCITPKIN